MTSMGCKDNVIVLAVKTIDWTSWLELEMAKRKE